MRKRTGIYKLLSFVLVFANIVFALPAHASWHCVTGEMCPATCNMVAMPIHAPGSAPSTACVMPCCKRGAMLNCAMAMPMAALPVLLTTTRASLCGSSTCVLRVQHARASTMPVAEHLLSLLPVKPLTLQILHASLKAQLTAHLLTSIIWRTLRPPPSRAPPGHIS